MSDPRFQYQDLRPTSISVAQLDSLMDFVVNNPKGYFGAIMASIKIVVVTAYVIAREKLQSQESQYLKQQYERSQASGNQSEIDQDNLSGEKK